MLVVPVGKSFHQYVDGLLSGVRWAGNPITYSDPDHASDYEVGHPEPLSDLVPISAGQMAAVHAALDTSIYTQPKGATGFSVEGFTRLDIDYAGAGSGTGTIRLVNTSDPPTAYAYAPHTGAWGGDVFFGRSGRQPSAGNYDYYVILHELGHSLGLKHGNDASVYGALPFATDSMEYSLLTNRSFIGSDARYVYNEPWGYPQTFMMYDIAALQFMYGADFTTNADDTVYSWSPTSGTTYVNGEVAIAPGGNRILQTIWDGGGIDAYDLSSYSTNLKIDLGPGGHSTFSTVQLAYLGGGPNAGYARGNVFNALQYQGDPASLIENAIGGSGNDIISGNAADNSLVGNAGDDTLRGRDGSDALHGGLGRDAIYGGRGDDTLSGGDGSDVLHGESGRDEISGGRGDDNLSGGDGSDVLHGGSGRDEISGGEGNDTLRGGNGADVLHGGPGRDAIYGGRGADTLIFDETSGSDIVPGFEAEVDMILLNGISLRSADAADLDGNGILDTLLSFSRGSAELLDVDITDLIASDPVAVFVA